MSILLFRGLPGTGKSYGVVENVILPALKQRRVIYTNIPLNDQLILNDFKSVINYIDIDEAEKNVEYLNNIESGAVVIIDEAWRLFPSGMRTDKIPEQVKSFFAEHRHKVSEDSGFTTEIVLITQNAADLCAFVRGKVESTYSSNKLKGLGTNKRYRVDIHEGCPQDGTNKEPTRQILGTYKKSVYQYYTSNTQNKKGVVANEKDVDTRNVIWKSPKFLAVSFFALLFLGYSASQLPNFKSQMSGGQTPKAKGQTNEKADIQTLQQEKQSYVKPARVSQPVYQPPTLDFIEQYKSVHITSIIKDGSYRRILFRFMIDSDTYIDFDNNVLSDIGYELVVMAECLVKVSAHQYSRYITCQTTEEKESRALVDKVF